MSSVHGPSGPTAAIETETESSVDVFDTSSDSGQSSTAKEDLSDLSATKAEEPINDEDATQERTNFYPITWRVIGGGVMMSGSRQCSLPC